jgi:hypothetical protein
MRIIYSIVLTIFLFASCDKKRELYNSKFCGKTNLNIESVNLEKIQLDSIATSFEGEFLLSENCLFFADRRFSWIYKFDINGNLLKKGFGKGKGPNEIAGGIKKTIIMSDDNLLALTTSNYLYKISPNLNEILRKKIKIERKNNFRSSKPPITNPSYYSFIHNRINMIELDSLLFYNIRIEHPRFNCIKHTEEFYANSHIIANIDLKIGKPLNAMGEYPPSFDENPIHQFNFSYFDKINNQKIIVGFGCDSLLYVYNKDFVLDKVFGGEGKHMNTKYRELKSYSEYKQYYLEEEEEKGYYLSVKSFNNILFRSYRKGKHNYDGLQIYQRETLIADIEVPKGFRVFGKYKDWYYAEVIDEQKENLDIYRFKVK